MLPTDVAASITCMGGHSVSAKGISYVASKRMQNAEHHLPVPGSGGLCKNGRSTSVARAHPCQPRDAMLQLLLQLCLLDLNMLSWTMLYVYVSWPMPPF